MFKKLLIVSQIILLVMVLYAQKTFTVAEANYFPSPNNSYENGDTTSDSHFFSLVLNAPIVINDKNTFLTGIRGNIWKVAYSPELIWPETFYSLGLTLGYNHKFNEKESFLFILLPRLNSDFRNIDSEALQLGFFTTYSKRSSEKFLWKLGVYFNQEFFGPFLVPLFGLNWDVSNKVSIVGDLPIYAKIKYKVGDNFSAGIGYVALVSSYRLTGEFNNAYSSRYAIEPFVFAEVKFLKQLYLNGKLGYTIGKNYPIYKEDDVLDFQLSFIKFGDDRTQLNPVILDNFFFEVGIAFKVDVAD